MQVMKVCLRNCLHLRLVLRRSSVMAMRNAMSVSMNWMVIWLVSVEKVNWLCFVEFVEARAVDEAVVSYCGTRPEMRYYCYRTDSDLFSIVYSD